MSEFELALDGFVVDARFGLLVAAAERHSFVLDFDVAVRAVHAVDHDDALTNVGGVTLLLLFFEDKHAGLVIVQNGHARHRILANQPTARALLVQLHEEILIRLPPVIVDNSNLNFCLALAILENNFFINFMIVFACLSISVKSSYMYYACSFCLVQNFNSKFVSCFTY